jgi:hypothetical protein
MSPYFGTVVRNTGFGPVIEVEGSYAIGSG